MKKKILICSLIVICLSVIAYSTTAYFTYEATATNVVTSGNVRIELQETALSEDGEAEIPFVDPIDVLPGTEHSKIVRVKNVGSQAAWIRIKLDRSIRLADMDAAEIDLSLVGYDLNTEYWTEKDGFFYYNTALEPDQTTEPLFTKVIFSAEMSNIYQHSEAVIEVFAQATQVIHNGESVFDAVGWPEVE